MTQYCTHPAEREWKPGDSAVLPEADTCDHDECRTSEPDGGYAHGGWIAPGMRVEVNDGPACLVYTQAQIERAALKRTEAD